MKSHFIKTAAIPVINESLGLQCCFSNLLHVRSEVSTGTRKNAHSAMQARSASERPGLIPQQRSLAGKDFVEWPDDEG
jgi:hypothetical protein